jgi:hypothetical protein
LIEREFETCSYPLSTKLPPWAGIWTHTLHVVFIYQPLAAEFDAKQSPDGV